MGDRRSTRRWSGMLLGNQTRKHVDRLMKLSDFPGMGT